MILVCFQGKIFNITVFQVYAPTSKVEEGEVDQFYEDLQHLLELTLKKDVFFVIGDGNAKVGSHEKPGVARKFGFGIQNESGQRLTVLLKEYTGHNKHLSPTTQEKTTHGHHQMVSTENRLIRLFATKDGEALYSQQKKKTCSQLTAAQIINCLLEYSGLN